MLFENPKPEKWDCMKCGNTNESDNLFCEYCGSAQPVDPVAVIKEKARGAMKQLNAQILTATNKRKCPACGVICSKEEIYCVSCGSKLDGDTSTPMQEIVPLEEPVTKKVVCLHCGCMNPDTLRFCDNCGEEIRKGKEVIHQTQSFAEVSSECCPECGARQLSGAVFCDECGAKLIRGNSYSQ